MDKGTNKQDMYCSLSRCWHNNKTSRKKDKIHRNKTHGTHTYQRMDCRVHRSLWRWNWHNLCRSRSCTDCTDPDLPTAHQTLRRFAPSQRTLYTKKTDNYKPKPQMTAINMTTRLLVLQRDNTMDKIQNQHITQ